ncbi:alpha/beta hydrolase [Acrocarpospora sp. B8E8]|uniref:alpha/beta hydrolase n=1 Tax=Acrocarpospora sp. B8E8 TaxID=3153572 RepID=UPI00325FD98A
MAADTAGLEATLSRVVRLADEHVSALDSCMRYMAAHSWVGGGAVRFSQELAEQRIRMQRGFQSTADEIAERIRAQGGHARSPSLATSIAVMSAAVPDGFAGMNVEAMTRLVQDLDRAARYLPEAAHRLSAELLTACVPSGPERQVADAGAWAAKQVPDLKRRLAILQRQETAPGLTSPAMAAFGLFGGFAPDSAGAAKALTLAATGDKKALALLLTFQRTGKDPTLAARFNAWWHLLDKQTQEHLIATAPNLIGGLNGLPAATRDRANRGYLTAQHTEITQRLEQLRRSAEAAKAEIATLELKLRQIDEVNKSLALGERDGRPPALLLSIGLGCLGRTAISFGDPDTADSVITSVPGTGTKLEGIYGDVMRASTLWKQAISSADQKKIASIAWFEYEAPQLDLSAFLADRSVSAPYVAAEGSKSLVSFTDGLNAAHKVGADPRFTVLGHSYGSLVAGFAARRRAGNFADQLILVGSPGVGASAAKELGVDQVWVGEAPQDPVADFGRVPASVEKALGGGLSPVLPDMDGPFGTDPSDFSFGAHQFVVDGPKKGLIDYDFAAHSSCWNADSQSLANMGYLINGQYHRVTKILPPIPTPIPQPSPTPPEPTSPAQPAEVPTATPSPSPQPAPTPPGG